MLVDYDFQKYKKVRLELPLIGKALSMDVYAQNDLISAVLNKEKIWEPYETCILASRLSEGDCFVDAGANIGYYTLIAHQLCGENGRVFAFEPEPENFKLLQINTQACANVEAFELALSNKAHSVPLSLCEDNSGDHRLVRIDGRDHKDVDTATGDSLIDGRVDFIKTDTQGAEYKVLSGLINTLSKNREHLDLLVEFWPHGLLQQGCFPSDLIDLIYSLEKDVYMIDHQRHRLSPVSADDLSEFCVVQSQHADGGGFTNLLITTGPVDDLQGAGLKPTAPL